MRSRLGPAIASLLIVAVTPLAAAGGRTSLDLSLPLGLLSGADGELTLSCGAPDDPETREMITALQHKGSRGRWQASDEDGRVSASRKGSRFRLRAWEDGAKKLDLRMPWEVAECLFGGREGERITVAVESLDAGGGLSLQLSGEAADISVSLD